MFLKPKRFYCSQCKKDRAIPHPYHGGCMKCGHKLKLKGGNNGKESNNRR